MKRIVPVIAFAAFLGVVGYVAVKFLIDSANAPKPCTLAELEKLQEQGEAAAPEIPRILACFERSDENLRFQAAETLSKIGPKAVDPVREKLKSRNAKVRYLAALTLALLGPDARDAADDLLGCLKDDDVSVRQKAVYALGKIDVKSDAVIGGLIVALGDPDEDVSNNAIEMLEKIGPPSKDALPTLAKLAGKDSPAKVRPVAIKLLGQMGAPAVPTFKELLKSSDTLDTIAIVTALAPLGEKAAPVLAELQTILIKSRHWDAEEEMLGVFKKCKTDGADGLANVLKTLCDPKSPHFAPNDGRCPSLLKAIGEIGADAKGTVPLLIDLLNERDGLRVPILDALGGIGPAAKQAIPAVEALINEKTPKDDPARIALRRMGKIETK